MKKISFLFIGTLVILDLSGCSTTQKVNNKNKPIENQVTKKVKTNNSTTISTSTETEIIDLSGIYYSTSGDTASIKSLDKNEWEISYSTLDGDVAATFNTKWENTGQIQQSKTPMKKSDKNSEFDVFIEYVNPSDIQITMEDRNPAHTMIFTKQKPKETKNEKYDVVLQGDLSLFSGQFSNDNFNKQIADSGFTLGGYSPDDYYNNRTTVFPMLTENGYWNGITSHGNYEVVTSDMPQKIDGYFKVNLHGTNAGANNGEVTFFLVPPNVSGPDGTTSDERRVFQVFMGGETRLNEYQKENWWKEYQ